MSGRSYAVRVAMDAFRGDVHVRDLPDGSVKVRVTIFSGPDFLTPANSRGAIFEESETGRYLAAKAVEALELLGIPVTGVPDGHEPAEPLLPEKRDESEYDRL